ncbi:unnamed protein product [Lathyrus sativus]|nr:unnamed protein product [Lathyrus sativus]
MSVLVNGSPTKDFQVLGGLRQGDPLSPFLFSIVAEGFSTLVKRATGFGMLKRFEVNEATSYNLLQFADDTIILCNGERSNLWAIKTIMKGLEMTFGLRINTTRSFLFDIGVDDYSLKASEQFLACRSGEIPFKFLGLKVGDKHNRLSYWNLVIEVFKTRLTLRKGRLLSIGGRVSLINSVLTNLPIHYLSFYKASKKVLEVLISLQHNFLWKGIDESKRLTWVKWESICKTKEE